MELELRKISRFVTLGDSLSDRGTLNRRRLLGIIPMRWISGLETDSPEGRFTNGLAWTDHVVAMFANNFMLNELKNPPEVTNKFIKFEGLDLADGRSQRSKRNHSIDATEISDALISQDLRLQKRIHDCYNLDDDKKINYEGENLARNYNEGGLTSYDYSWVINSITSWRLSSFKLFFVCLILATLNEKRTELLRDDKSHKISKQHKAETLVIEWSGGNDLITANLRPTRDVADKAVAARLNNLKQLMQNGYRHFVWFNLPDLSLTPRYQAMSQVEQDNARVWSEYFNQELNKAYKELSVNYPQCSFELFDVNKIFSDIYREPEKYHFDANKLKEPYTKSESFRLNKNGTSPGSGYMFWDEIHPSADLHAIVAEKFQREISLKYTFSPPKPDAVEEEIPVSKDSLLKAFKNISKAHSGAPRRGFFHSASPVSQLDSHASLDDILSRALYGGDKRAFSLLKELQWLDAKGNLNLNIRELKKAMHRVHEAQLHETDKIMHDEHTPLLAH